MRMLRNRSFAQFCKKNRIPDQDLCELIAKMTLGAIDADLGGGVYKQRLRRRGQGKSGSYRTILVFRTARLAVFVFGYAKKDLDNLRRDDLLTLRALAKEMFSYDDKTLAQIISAGRFEEIACAEEIHVSHS